jgi:hypothetical protein
VSVPTHSGNVMKNEYVWLQHFTILRKYTLLVKNVLQNALHIQIAYILCMHYISKFLKAIKGAKHHFKEFLGPKSA